jgi:hypothetical protein
LSGRARLVSNVGRGAAPGAAFEPIIGIRTRIRPSSAGWV